ncbi:MAG: hypothetical protein MSG64_19905 [Pyrinomonadaceae bacterium MAG19_C2-C3]|nr:hypothetical protein [Pyrinomonadaceae bacterium MAG19_C2-C3]
MISIEEHLPQMRRVHRLLDAEILVTEVNYLTLLAAGAGEWIASFDCAEFGAGWYERDNPENLIFIARAKSMAAAIEAAAGRVLAAYPEATTRLPEAKRGVARGDNH